MYAYKDFYGGKAHIPTPGGALPYLSHMDICRPKEYESGYDFAHFGLEATDALFLYNKLLPGVSFKFNPVLLK